jgi:hypothetical protein
MAAIKFSKDPDEVLDYELDWSPRLAEDTIALSEWLMPTPATGVIAKDSDAKSTTTTTIWVSGGTLGKDYSIVNRIVTAGGRTMDQTCLMRVRTR